MGRKTPPRVRRPTDDGFKEATPTIASRPTLRTQEMRRTWALRRVFKKLFSRCLATTGGTALRRFIRFRHCLIFVRLSRLN